MKYISIEVPYNCVLIATADMFATIIEKTHVMTREYENGKYVYKVCDREMSCYVVDEAELTAARVVERLS